MRKMVKPTRRVTWYTTMPSLRLCAKETALEVAKGIFAPVIEHVSKTRDSGLLLALSRASQAFWHGGHRTSRQTILFKLTRKLMDIDRTPSRWRRLMGPSGVLHPSGARPTMIMCCTVSNVVQSSHEHTTLLIFLNVRLFSSGFVC